MDLLVMLARPAAAAARSSPVVPPRALATSAARAARAAIEANHARLRYLMRHAIRANQSQSRSASTPAMGAVRSAGATRAVLGAAPVAPATGAPDTPSSVVLGAAVCCR